MNRVIAWFVANPVAANLLMMVLIVGGLVTLPSIRQEEFPSIDLEIVLRRKRMLTDVQLDALRAIRLDVLYCNLSDFIPSLRNAELLPEELVRRHTMFPLFAFAGVITLVIQDPVNLTAIDQVRRLTRKDVDVCLASGGDIQGLIERAYGASKYLAQSTAESPPPAITIRLPRKSSGRATW